jgi:transposase
MSPAFISGVEKHFPEAQLTFDKFHALKILNEAVDEVRRQEQQSRPELKRTRYIWLKNPENLKESQAATLETLQVKKLNLKTARGYRTIKYLITMIYLIGGKLEFRLPT